VTKRGRSQETHMECKYPYYIIFYFVLDKEERKRKKKA